MLSVIKKNLQTLIPIILLLLIIPVIIVGLRYSQTIKGKANYLAPKIVIDARIKGKMISPFWCGMAQGGEVDNKGLPVSLDDVIIPLAKIKPCYIRIDHIYDIYAKVNLSEEGKLIIDWTLLDKVVENIIATGALPFLALSYMPPAIADKGDIIGLPKDWNLWKELIAETVKHYSGPSGLNLTNVYYEVWNEPDLFGNWQIGGEKDYRQLYKYASLGAQSAENTKQFYLGGPATTHPIYNWFTDFLTFVNSEKLRLDFLSWHRYTFQPKEIESEIEKINQWLVINPNFLQVPKIITEWGSDSENNDLHDSTKDGIYTLFTSTYLANKIDYLFSFEIKDGPSPSGKKYWGRWGLFTNEQYGLSTKPKYWALDVLNNIIGEQLEISGQGSFVRGLATKNGETIKILLVNYLPPGFGSVNNPEIFPLTIKNLAKGVYHFKWQKIYGEMQTESTEEIRSDVWEKTLSLEDDSAYLLTLIKERELANFSQGKWEGTDLALNLDNLTPSISYPADKISTASGTIEFYLKFNLPISSFKDETLFSLPINNEQKLIAKKRLSPAGFSTEITFGFFEKEKPLEVISSSINDWNNNEWHHLAFVYDTTLKEKSYLKMYFDGKLERTIENIDPFGITGDPLTIGHFDGMIEELRISNIVRDPVNYFLSPLIPDQNTIILRHFNGRVEE